MCNGTGLRRCLSGLWREPVHPSLARLPLSASFVCGVGSMRRLGVARVIGGACCMVAVHAHAAPAEQPPPQGQQPQLPAGTAAQPARDPGFDPAAPGPELPPEAPQSLVRAGKLREALVAVEQVLRVQPGDAEARLLRARLLFWLGHGSAARTEAEALLRLHPDDTDILELIAQLRLVAGDREGAIAGYERMEMLGVVRSDLHQRLIDLYVEVGRLADARAALRLGGQLNGDQALAIDRALHPWQFELGGTIVNAGLRTWPRAGGAVSRRLADGRLVLLGGGEIEARPEATDVGWRAELYAGLGRLAAMVHASGSPTHSFLPTLDLRLDGSFQIRPAIAVGAYLRFARYDTLDVAGFSPTVSLTVRNWTFSPGYMLVQQLPGVATHTGYLKARWDRTARTAWLAWLYYGQDSAFVERFGSAPGGGVTVLVGVDHWFTGRLGVRASVSRVQPLQGAADAWNEIGLMLRGKL